MLQDILDVPADEVRAGLRVQAVWTPESERRARGDRQPQRAQRRRRDHGVGSPTGEPDVPEGEFQDKVF